MPTKAELERLLKAQADELEQLKRNAQRIDAEPTQHAKARSPESPRYSASESPRQQPGGRSVNWLAIALLMMLTTGGCTAGVGTIGYVGYRIWDAQQNDRDDRTPRPQRNLVDQIRAAGVSERHAVYFAKVCDGVANRLEADGGREQRVFQQRKEVADLLGAVGSLAVTGTDAAYRELPEIIESAFQKVFETDADGQIVGGELTTSDRREAVGRFRSLAGAFAEAAR